MASGICRHLIHLQFLFGDSVINFLPLTIFAAYVGTVYRCKGSTSGTNVNPCTYKFLLKIVICSLDLIETTLVQFL